MDHSNLIDILGHAEHIISIKSNIISSHSFFTADEVLGEVNNAVDVAQSVADPGQAVSIYSKIDKTGFIGFFANFIEIGIDAGHNALKTAGLKNTYGFSIAIFTLLIKILTLPLTTAQLESTTKMQKLQPLQQKIQAKYANDEQTKNQLVAQLFQTANVNPLAGCFPALVQIPIFISLYRALQNLVAENKLDEPFLWIPDLEGPVYSAPPSESLDWVKSIIGGSPKLGWEDTIAFLTIPVILFISQSISSKLLQPPRDPNKPMTEQEQFSQGLVQNIPFIIAFFSLNVPAGLAVYWIVNNILTTVVTVIVKQQFKDDELPLEVVSMMAQIEGDITLPKKKTASSSAVSELRKSPVQEMMKPEGFGTVVDAEIVSPTESATQEATGDQVTETVKETTTVEPVAVKETPKKRKKRVKPASRKKKD
eukprot:CAMPEP_0182418796 /NCGR_PEP_ID=MMETSP1167-20130531/3171_1 /TAXON_ID=2988 /ORGANISM="Mallomonas Sp, Strain CCMP3275" /LENGTH=422 /DNA_ID=CAMNT_0024593195 /DNA_START=227 /DNA_END=1495 /DNA_ORIENTATION=-